MRIDSLTAILGMAAVTDLTRISGPWLVARLSQNSYSVGRKGKRKRAMRIETACTEDYPELLLVWERSVRATHDFLAEPDILSLRPLILEHYFDAVELFCVRDRDEKILGFSGVADGNLEMLFIAPDSRGQGIGTALCRHAVDCLGVTRVDVNEQNPQALGFYKHFGFKVVARSPLDGQGNPFPLLHLTLD